MQIVDRILILLLSLEAVETSFSATEKDAKFTN